MSTQDSSSDQAAQSAQARPARHAKALGLLPVIVLLAGHWVMAVTGVSNKSTTFDEIAHLTAGYAYWKFNDYRLDPENGNLPGRLAALPVLAGAYRYPSLDQAAWRESSQWSMGQQFFHEQGNDLEGMLLRGRMAMALLSVALAALVYVWARGLFGPAGGMVALLLCVFDTTVLANGPLMTSDLTATLMFALALFAFWRLLARVTPLRLAASGLAMGGLFVAKMSAMLILPMALALMVVRLLTGRPLEVALARVRLLYRRWQQALALAGIAAAHALAVLLVIWGCYGFRYSAFGDSRPDNRFPFSWSNMLRGGGAPLTMVGFARDHRLLPEAYLYGLVHAARGSNKRPAFLNGDYSLTGWWHFFPYSFLVKTPLATLATLALAAAAGVAGLKARAGCAGQFKRRLREALYRTSPLWVLLVTYGAFAIRSHLNIGHRHLLPIYPALFVLAAASARWLGAAYPRRRILAGLLLAGLAAESLLAWPNYLAAFNALAGGRANAYRHLVDSSLDWGQDLPGLKQWADKTGLSRPGHEPVYLSYFGTASPGYFRIDAVRLPSFLDAPEGKIERPLLPPLRPGWYCISATMLQTLWVEYWGPWRQDLEQMYQQARSAGLERYVGQTDNLADLPADTQAAIKKYDQLRFSRLCAYLRSLRPTASIAHTILVFHLGAGDIERALQGEPVELGRPPRGLPP